jgi:hypothetical protein
VSRAVDTNLDPLIGHWYRSRARGQPLLVVDIDEDRDLVKVQYPDGDTGEIGTGAWRTMGLELVAPPKIAHAEEEDSTEGAPD